MRFERFKLLPWSGVLAAAWAACNDELAVYAGCRFIGDDRGGVVDVKLRVKGRGADGWRLVGFGKEVAEAGPPPKKVLLPDSGSDTV